jgi:hypothetical protein
LIAITIFLPLQAHAQFAGANAAGDVGMSAGTQPPPGFYMVPMVFRYKADTLRDSNGDSVAPLGGGANTSADAAVVGLIYVTDKKVFGGNYGASIYPSVTNNALGLPILPIQTGASTGFGDLYIQPANLGWYLPSADFTAGIGIYAPTGEFDIDGVANRGLGMWTFEVYGGTTYYLDADKTWSLAAMVAYETHDKKDGTDIRVGDIVTLEGGIGKSFKGGMFSAGLAYFGQWKVTDDDLGVDFDLPPGINVGRDRVYGFGPEFTVPLASKSKLFGFLTLRYTWQTGARSTLEGTTFVATLSMPIPAMSLQ